MHAPEGLIARCSGTGKHPLVVRMTGNSIILFEKALTSFFENHPFPVSVFLGDQSRQQYPRGKKGRWLRQRLGSQVPAHHRGLEIAT
jgi:hypothetical protein